LRGQYIAEKKYLKERGIDYGVLGVKDMTPEAKKKYLHVKYKGGGFGKEAGVTGLIMRAAGKAHKAGIIGNKTLLGAGKGATRVGKALKDPTTRVGLTIGGAAAAGTAAGNMLTEKKAGIDHWTETRGVDRAIREGNLLVTSPQYQAEFRKNQKKYDLGNIGDTKWTRIGVGAGAAGGGLIGAGIEAFKHKGFLKNLKNLRNAAGVGAALGSVAGVAVGSNVDNYNTNVKLDKVIKRTEANYLKSKGIRVTPTGDYKFSPEALDKYITNYNRRKIKAQRILNET
jgi:hypothetical protein